MSGYALPHRDSALKRLIFWFGRFSRRRATQLAIGALVVAGGIVSGVYLPSGGPPSTSSAGSTTTGPPPTFDYYIAPNGSDSNPGTQSLPFADFNKCYHTANISTSDKVCGYSGDFPTGTGFSSVSTSQCNQCVTYDSTKYPGDAQLCPHHVIFAPVSGTPQFGNDSAFPHFTGWSAMRFIGSCIRFMGPFTSGAIAIGPANSGATHGVTDVVVDGVSSAQTTVHYLINLGGTYYSGFKNLFSNGYGPQSRAVDTTIGNCTNGASISEGPDSTLGPYSNVYAFYDHVHWVGCSHPGHLAECLHPYVDGIDSVTVSQNYFEWCENAGSQIDNGTGQYDTIDPIPGSPPGTCADKRPSYWVNNVYGPGVLGPPLQAFYPDRGHFWNYTIAFNSAIGGFGISNAAYTGSFCNIRLIGNSGRVASTAACGIRPGTTVEHEITFQIGTGNGCVFPGTGNAYFPNQTFAGLYGSLYATSDNFTPPPGSPLIGAAQGASYVPSTDYAGNPRPCGLLDVGAYDPC